MLSTNRKILCVENSLDGYELINQMQRIEKCDFELTPADSAIEALTFIGGQEFDLYLLEYKLPDISGVELCRRIRQMKRRAPVLFYTGMARPADRAAALAAGANEYLIKPNDLDSLIPTMRRLVNENAARRPPEPSVQPLIYDRLW